MNQMRMDAEGGGRVIQRGRHGRWLAVVVALQNLLVVACLLVTLYFYWNFQPPEDDVYIKFDGTKGPYRNNIINLGSSYKANMVEVSENNETIKISCTGPYIFYMEFCPNSIRECNGMLQLHVTERDGTPKIIHNFTLDATLTGCRGLHSIVYLKANEEASLHMSSECIEEDNLIVGMSYLLGRRCDY